MDIADRQFDAYQSVVLAFKIDWSTRVFRDVRDTYLARVDASHPPADADEVAALMDGATTAQMFAWFERHLQRLKYSGRWGLQTHYDAHRASVTRGLGAAEGDVLELDPNFRQPAYYTAVDIHQHPGGVWSDEIAGAVYQRGANSTTPLSASHGDLHQRFTREVLARRRPGRLLDMGCGFGKSTEPFADALPDARIIAVDLAAPCLRVAAHEAASSQRRNVRYSQRDASRTGLPDASFDVVTSTMLLHEMPPPVIRDTIAESIRLLEPGGLMIHLDFLPPDDAFGQWVHYGHGRRNNEPFMEPLAKMDVLGAMRDAGLTNVRAVPFEESPGAATDHAKWRFPWTMIMGEKADREKADLDQAGEKLA